MGNEGSKRIGNRIAGRACAVCGKRTGEHTYGFRSTLADNGLSGDKAHVRCIKTLKNAVMKRDRLK